MTLEEYRRQERHALLTELGQEHAPTKVNDAPITAEAIYDDLIAQGVPEEEAADMAAASAAIAARRQSVAKTH